MSDAAVVIRPATPRDLPEIVALWEALQATSAAYEPRLTPNDAAPAWFSDFLLGELTNDQSHVLVAVSDDGVIGFTFGQIMRRPTLRSGDCGYIADLCVRENARGQGIGRRLFVELRDWFRAQGLHALEAQVVRANPASQAFWRKMGFGDFLRTLRTEE